MTLCISYDSTFDGFLSVVFEIYRQRLSVGDIQPDRVEGAAGDLFMHPFRIETSMEAAARIRRAIVNAASDDVLKLLETAYKSEEAGVEMKMLMYLRKLFSGVDPNYGKNVATEEMLPLYKIAQSVRHEAGNMLGMVRFSRTDDGIYFAEIEPKYDILGMMIPHFRGRFANERWAIYDSQRKYGAFYDGGKVVEIVVPNLDALKEASPADAFTQMWKDYYNAIAIAERENPRLLRRCLPVRYWKHLPERGQGGASKAVGVLKLPSSVAKFNATLQKLPTG